MPALRLITPPDPAVTLAEAKAHLRVDHSDDDASITALVGAAVAYLDGWTGVLGRALESQTWEMAIDAFPTNEIALPLGPVASVTSVKYTDADGVEQTVDSADYEVDTAAVEGWVVPSDGWPATMSTINAVRVQWIAGTGCPEAVKHAIKLLIGHWYENREAVGAGAELPLAVKALITPWRRVGI